MTDVEKELEAFYKEENDAWSNHDLETILSHYCDDAVTMFPDLYIEGKEGIKKDFESFIDSVDHLTIEHQKRTITEGMVVDTGIMKNKWKGERIKNGMYCITFVKRDGKFKIKYDMRFHD